MIGFKGIDTILYSNKSDDKYNVSIKLNPLPKSCCQCPFYYMPSPEDEHTWFEHWTCFLGGIKDEYGIALNRSKDCPL